MIYTYRRFAPCCAGLSLPRSSLHCMTEGSKRRSERHDEERSASRRRLALSQDQQEPDLHVPRDTRSDGFERVNLPGLPLIGTVSQPLADLRSSGTPQGVSFQCIAIPGISNTRTEYLEPPPSSSHATPQFERIQVPSQPAYQLPVPVGAPIEPSMFPPTQRSSAGQGVRRKQQADSSDWVSQPQERDNYNKVCSFLARA